MGSFLLYFSFCLLNRFDFSIEGTWYAPYRTYYDIIINPLNTKIYQNEKTIGETKNFNTFKTFSDDSIKGKLTYLKACQILSMIYFSLLLIIVKFTAVVMMFYACLKRQGNLIIFMHVLWNIIRFFIFSFFLALHMDYFLKYWKIPQILLIIFSKKMMVM